MTARKRRSGWDQTRRDLYLIQRGMGDASAAGKGRLGRRLVRRTLVRSIFRSLGRL